MNVTNIGASSVPASSGDAPRTACRWSVNGNTEPIIAAVMSMATPLAARKARCRKRPSGSIGAAARRSTTTKPTSAVAASTSAVITGGRLQPTAGPSMSA